MRRIYLKYELFDTGEVQGYVRKRNTIRIDLRNSYCNHLFDGVGYSTIALHLD